MVENVNDRWLKGGEVGVGYRGSEDGGREAKDGGRKVEDGGRKVEDGGWKAEGGGGIPSLGLTVRTSLLTFK